MSATITVSLQEMNNQEVVMRMLRARLGNLLESDQHINGTLSHAGCTWGDAWLSYNKSTKLFSFDGDWRNGTENRLNELYQIEAAKLEAENLGCQYTEVMDPNTGEITLVVDDIANQFDHLAMEAS